VFCSMKGMLWQEGGGASKNIDSLLFLWRRTQDKAGDGMGWEEDPPEGEKWNGRSR
jgi:hypothetical protein